MSELPGLLADHVEPVPNQLRILASAESLGTLRSVHRPTSWLTAIQFRQGRIYLFDQGFVLRQANGAMRLFRWGQITARKAGSAYLITGADHWRMVLSKKWSGFPELERAITTGVGSG